MFSKLYSRLPLVAFALVRASAGARPPMPSIVAPPEVAADPANQLILELSTGGTVVILLRPDLAPHHVERIQTLVRRGFYNGLTFHRVIPGFMAQGGDPKGTGEGGSDLPDLKAEFTRCRSCAGRSARRGRDSPDSANSQFFIMFAPKPDLDGKYTVFGRVIAGMDAVDAIAPGEPPPSADENCEGVPRRLSAAPMRVDLFDFELPHERIALRPARPRDSARLLLVEGERHFRPSGARSAGPASARRRAGVQRHQGHPRAARRAARRCEHRRDAAQARRAARMAGVPAQRQAGASRRHASTSAKASRASVVEKCRRWLRAAALPRR